jgi:hypothetical protein
VNTSELASALPPLIILAALAVGILVYGRSGPSGRNLVTLIQGPATEPQDRA